MIGHLEDDYKTNHLDAVNLWNKSETLIFCMKFENIFCYIKSFIDLVYKVIKASIQVLICYAYQLLCRLY